MPGSPTGRHVWARATVNPTPSSTTHDHHPALLSTRRGATTRPPATSPAFDRAPPVHDLADDGARRPPISRRPGSAVPPPAIRVELDVRAGSRSRSVRTTQVLPRRFGRGRGVRPWRGRFSPTIVDAPADRRPPQPRPTRRSRGGGHRPLVPGRRRRRVHRIRRRRARALDPVRRHVRHHGHLRAVHGWVRRRRRSSRRCRRIRRSFGAPHRHRRPGPDRHRRSGSRFERAGRGDPGFRLPGGHHDRAVVARRGSGQRSRSTRLDPSSRR